MAKGGANRNVTAKPSEPVAPKRPAAARTPTPPSIEDQLFFTRIRLHAKWVFVLLILAFLGGFVLFGVGSGSSGLGDLLNGSWIFGSGNSGSTTPGVKKAQGLVKANPKSADAFRALSTAYQSAGKPDSAIAPLTTYTQLKPKDTDALLELAALYSGKAQRLTRQAQIKQAYPLLTPGTPFLPDTNIELGRALSTDQSVSAVQCTESTRVSDLYTQVNSAYASQVAVYKRLVALDPTDASLLVQLGQAQQQTGDTAGAIASYKKFLKLAPDDPSAGAVATQLKSLEPAPAATSKVPATPSK
jgi:tetratricopeptide (TPR) repeat protein